MPFNKNTLEKEESDDHFIIRGILKELRNYTIRILCLLCFSEETGGKRDTERQELLL